MAIKYLPQQPGPIGLFDSGYGGLTILEGIRKRLPQYDYLYLGDNARTPYGTRSFEVVYEFTLQAVRRLFELGCHLVILACNTASAKALRSIQINDLPYLDPDRRVLGVIRPTVEKIGDITQNGHVGLLGTLGTVRSQSYDIELAKFYPNLQFTGVACPMWVPLIENNEYDKPGADYFVQKYITELLDKDPEIDTIILGCTHYPLLMEKIKQCTPPHIKLVPQGAYVSESLESYLQRHPAIEQVCSKNGGCEFLTTEQPEKFTENAAIFLNQTVTAKKITLE
ncbi:MAG: glutamate racemase [Bacteroidales bacterium]|nr:glutamate racemase [Bacteroidales bacterium]